MDDRVTIVPMTDLSLARAVHLAAYTAPTEAAHAAPVVIRTVIDLCRYRVLSEKVRDLETSLLIFAGSAAAQLVAKRISEMRPYLASDMAPQRES